MATNARPIGPLTRLIVGEIRATLTRLEWTYAQLSERSGIPLRTLEKILRHERAMDVEQLGSIAVALDVTPDILIAAAHANAEIYLPDGRLNPAQTRGAPPSDEKMRELAARKRASPSAG